MRKKAIGLLLAVLSCGIFSTHVHAAPPPGLMRGMMPIESSQIASGNVANATDGSDGNNVALKPGGYVIYEFYDLVNVNGYYKYSGVEIEMEFFSASGTKIGPTISGSTGVTSSYTGITMIEGVKRVKLTNVHESLNRNIYEVDLTGNYQPPDTTPPESPTNLVAIEGDKYVDLSWTGVGDADLDHYEIYRDGSYLTNVSKTETTYRNTGLKNMQTYTFYVLAVDIAGNKSGQSNSVTATPKPPPDTIPPARPTGLRVHLESSGRIWFEWNANNEPDISHYNLYIDGVALASNITGTSYQVSAGAIASGTHSFQLSAVDTSENESLKSDPVVVEIAGNLSVTFVPNADQIIVQVIGGDPPYTVDWGQGSDTFSASMYTIEGLQLNTEYTVTVTDANGDSITKVVNTGSVKSFVPPVFPDPVELFQQMLNTFEPSGEIALAIALAAVALGVIVVIGIYGWRISKKWLRASK